MQNSMMTARRQSNEESLDPLLTLLAQDHGNAYEQIDPYTLEIISILLPTSGIEFLSRILQHATVIQNVLPNLETLGERVAVINTRTIRLLSQAIEWGYDTTHKYVSVLMSLELLYRHKHTTGNMLVFPLKTYELPRNLNALDKLITQSRPKVQQFARRVKERLLSYKFGYQVEQEIKGTPRPSERDINLQQLLVGSMIDVMKSEGIDNDRVTHIALRLMKEVISKFVSPKQNTTMQTRHKSSTSGQTYTPQSRSNKKSLPAGIKEKTQAPFQQKEKSAASIVSGSLQQSRPMKKVSSIVENKSTQFIQKEDLHRESTVSPVKGRLTDKESLPPIASLPAVQGDLSPAPQQVSYKEEKKMTIQSQETNTIVYLPTKEIYIITEVLSFYQRLLENNEIDWSQMLLSKTFFEEIYAKLNDHYQRAYAINLIVRMKTYMWQSIEANIVRKAADLFGVDREAACEYVFELSGRYYEVDQELKRHCYTPTLNAAQPQNPMKIDAIIQKEAEDQYELDQYPVVTTTEVDQYSSGSTPKNAKGKTLAKRQPAITQQESSYEQPKEDSRSDKSSPEKSSYDNNEERSETFLEAKRRRQSEEYMALGDPEIKSLRIPAEVDPNKYLEAFTYVLRNRNINILFNNITKNDTLRNNAAQFLTYVFDHDNNNITVNKQNENLLTRYEPDVIISAFIDTIIALHEPGNESLQNPGAFFTSRCKFYECSKPDFETTELINRFSNMSYRAFAGEMHILINSNQKIRTKHYKKRSQ